MYKKILVPLDGSKLAECVFPHLETIIKGGESTELIIMQAVEPISIPYSREASHLTSLEQLQSFETHQKADAEKYLKEIVSRLTNIGLNVRAEIIYGKPAEAISEYVTKNGIDLVVIATHGRSGVSRFVWGSVADKILRSVCVPVLMIRAPGCTPGV
jgi:nucleotide-binding universal stress UspA family protein